MNRIYRLVFNRALGVMQVVSELATTASRVSGATATRGGGQGVPVARSVLTVMLAICMLPAQAAGNKKPKPAPPPPPVPIPVDKDVLDGSIRFWDGQTVANDRVDGGSGEWSLTGAQWTNMRGTENGTMETDQDVVFSGTAGTVTIVDPTGSLRYAGMELGDGYRIQGDAIVVGLGKRVTVDRGEATIASAFTGTGGLQKAGSGTLILEGDSTYAGATEVRFGTLQVTGSGSITGTSNVNLGTQASLTGRLAITKGAVVTATDTVYVGVHGTGELLLSEGGQLNNARGSIGGTAGAVGVASIAGTGSTWTNTADLSVGGLGTGTLSIVNGGVVGNVDGFIGDLEGSTGTVTVSGSGSRWNNSGYLDVGSEGQGTLRIENGGSVSSHSGDIGFEVNATGSVIVTGTGSTWTNNDDLDIGAYGQGMLLIEQGGLVNSSNTAVIGQFAGAEGTVTVRDSGSRWQNNGGLLVGQSGTGTLNIDEGGYVINHNGVIGALTGSIGTVNVAGGNWRLSGVDSPEFSVNGLAVGLDGEGALAITDGGEVMVNTGSAGAGVQVGSHGAISVVGARSNFIAADDMMIGVDGHGQLTLAQGGVATVGYRMTTVSVPIRYENRPQPCGMPGWPTCVWTAVEWTDMLMTSQGYGTLQLGVNAGSSGTLNIGAAAGDDAAAAGVLDAAELVFGAGNGTINFNHTDDNYRFTSAISGDGVVNVLAGTTHLIGDSSAFTGTATVWGGHLVVDGRIAAATRVEQGGTLSGNGTIASTVTVTDGGVLEGHRKQTLTMDSLLLQSGAQVNVALGVPNEAPLFDITGDLTLDGQLNVANAGIGIGVYRLFDYGGTLTDNIMDIGSLPFGRSSADFFLQTSLGGQVNLVSTAGHAFSFWDGGDSAFANNGSVDGGSGTWTLSGTEWTGVDGASNSVFTPSAFAVFQGTAGTVMVDSSAGDVHVAGMQFAVDGYRVEGDAITLVGDVSGTSTLVVGDGGSDDAYKTATIVSELTGTDGLLKAGAGTLVLEGANSYAGNTIVEAGTLRAGTADAFIDNSGYVVNGGTLDLGGHALTMASLSGTGGSVGLGEFGIAFLGINQAADTIFAGTIDGSGGIRKYGTGTLTLTGTNRYSGSTEIDGGTLALAQGGQIDATTSLYIGGMTDSVGRLDVGAGSRATVLSELVVGLSGSGHLDIRDGGQVSSGWGYIGEGGGSDGFVEVSGSGSRWDNVGFWAGELEIGGYGSGHLRILNGGQVSSSTASIGAGTLGNGSVEVSGSGSQWFSGFNLSIGQRGTGTLTIADGGIVSTTNTLLLAWEWDSQGTLNIGAGAGESAAATGTLDATHVLFGTGSGVVNFNHTDSHYNFTAALTGGDGSRSAINLYAGGTVFTGNSSSYAGITTVHGGSLTVDGMLGGALTVQRDGTLTGSGTVGATTVSGTLAGQAGQTLTMETLTLNSDAVVAAQLGAAGNAALFAVNGNLGLGGTLDITGQTNFGVGVYRLFNYGGTLSSGLSIGAVPTGAVRDDLAIQTAVGGQVNLVSSVGTELRFWDGGGIAHDGVVAGGDGSWRADGVSWTSFDGAINGKMKPDPGFAVFQAAPGTVTVDNSAGDAGVTGMQFTVGGYRLQGDAIRLEDSDGVSTLVVGDGSADDASKTATIASVLTGANALHKTGAGTLVLAGANSYAGNTIVEAGTLRAGTADAFIDNSGYVVNGGTLDLGGHALTMASLSGTGGSVGLGNAALTIDQSANTLFSGAITGNAGINKRGAGTLTLSGVSNYAGRTVIDGGTLALAQGGRIDATGILDIAQAAGSMGKLDVSAGSGVTVSRMLYVGQFGQGEMTIQAGGRVDSGRGRIGENTGAQGLVTVAGEGAQWNLTSATDDLFVGNAGTGTLRIEAGGSVSSAYGTIGDKVGGDGRVVVSGEDAAGTASIWVNHGRLMVGNAGKGSLIIEDAGQVTSTGTWAGIGIETGSSGSVEVSGMGSQWANSNNLEVGSRSSGELRILAGGELINGGRAVIGFVDGASGSVDLTGSGSLWDNAGHLTVGYAGTGILNITNGGALMVRGPWASIGHEATGQGAVTVDGAGSRWSTQGNLAMGHYGSGSLTVSNGGTVASTGALVLGNIIGSKGSLNVGAAAGEDAAVAGVLDTAQVVFGAGAGQVVFNHTDVDYRVAAGFSGNGAIDLYSGGTLFTGDSNAFTGITTVRGGWLKVNGTLGGTLGVDTGAILGGSGTVGSTTVHNGGTLAPGNSIGTLAVNGDLTLEDGAMLAYELGQPGASLATPGSSDHLAVSGNLNLDGELGLSGQETGVGYYRLISYGGVLTDNGLEIGSVPSGFHPLQFSIDSAHAGVVDLVVRSNGDDQLQYWHGGAWRNDAANWMNQGGVAAVEWAGHHGVFNGVGENVSIESAMAFQSLQFVTNGYTLVADSGGELVTDAGANELRVLAGVSATIDAPISGSGGIEKTEGGTLILGGNNSYTGGTQLSAGVLQVSSDAHLGAATGALNFNGGVLRVADTTFTGTQRAVVLDAGGGGFDIAEAGHGFTLSQNITGNGDLFKLGAGTLLLTGSNRYGNTTVAAGTLVGDADSIQGNLQNNARVEFDQADDAQFSGRISGSGVLLKRGDGSLRLSGDSGTYTGTTQVAGGALHVNGRLGGVLSVQSGAWLKGVGSVGNTTIQTGGTLAPGNSIGTLTVNGDLRLAQGSFYELEVDAAGNSDRINVSGAVTLEGGSLLVLEAAGDWQPLTVYTFLTAAGGINGRFGSVDNRFAFLDPTLVYSANNISLSLARNNIDFAQVAQTFNQRGAAGVAEALGFGHAIYEAIVRLEAVDARAAFDGLSGEIHASTQATLLDDSRHLRGAIVARLHDDQGLSLAGGPAVHEDADSGRALWVQAYGSWGQVDTDGNAADLARSASGLLFGLDLAPDETWRLGLAGGMGSGDAKVDARTSRADFRSKSLAAYLGKQWQAWRLRAGAGYSWNQVDTRRTLDIGNVVDRLDADYQANSAQAFAEIGYALTFDAGVLEPFLATSYVELEREGFGEHGGVAALVAEGEGDQATLATLGLHATTDFSAGNLRLGGQATLGWQHAFGDVTPEAALAFVGDDAFAVAGLPLMRDGLVIDAGLIVGLGARSELAVDYNGQIGNGVQDHGVRAQFSLRF